MGGGDSTKGGRDGGGGSGGYSFVASLLFSTREHGSRSKLTTVLAPENSDTYNNLSLIRPFPYTTSTLFAHPFPSQFFLCGHILSARTAIVASVLSIFVHYSTKFCLVTIVLLPPFLLKTSWPSLYISYSPPMQAPLLFAVPHGHIYMCIHVLFLLLTGISVSCSRLVLVSYQELQIQLDRAGYWSVFDNSHIFLQSSVYLYVLPVFYHIS